jgi:hypothetical protein
VNLYTWAARWQIPLAAIADLQAKCGLDGTPGIEATGKSEAFAQSQVVLEGARKGVRLFRNNVGVLEDRNGRPVRFGLANRTAEENAAIKSGDLIGIRPVTVTPAHVGTTLGVFVSREIKEPGWRYAGTEREVAQLRWAELILACGGDAGFATGEGSL